MQNYEMEKYKKLNEDVLDDESNPELIDLMRTIGKELQDTVLRFKAIAKAKGIRYEIAAAKKEAVEKKIGIESSSIAGTSLATKTLVDGGEKSRTSPHGNNSEEHLTP